MPIISAVCAQQFLVKGCVPFSIMIINSSSSGANVADIPVVREYADVFPDELLGMPLEREIEFGIELEAGTKPISKAPYRMELSELQELMSQL